MKIIYNGQTKLSHIELYNLCKQISVLSRPKIIKLKLETILKSQASDWLKLETITAIQMLEI